MPTITDSIPSHVAVGERLVTRTHILTTRVHVYRAWERYAGHSTVRTVDGERWGLVTARPLPEEIERMRPGSPERVEACELRRAALYAEARELILEAYPDLRDWSPWPMDGEYSTVGEPKSPRWAS
jgi:hypothetical protein